MIAAYFSYCSVSGDTDKEGSNSVNVIKIKNNKLKITKRKIMKTILLLYLIV